MPQQSEGDLEDSQLLTRPAVQLTINTDSREKGFFVVPDWWASVVPGGFDFCNFRNAPRFALLVVLLTVVILAWQHLVRLGKLKRDSSFVRRLLHLSFPDLRVSCLC